MYNWGTLKTLSTVLLCLPLLHLAYLSWQTVTAYVDPSPEAWKADMQAIIELDQRSRLPSDPILITGGQSVRLWKDLPETIGSSPTLMRPLGDATLDDLSFYYDRLIGYYRPSVLVVMPSYSDLYLRDNKTAEEMAAALTELMALNASLGVTSRRYIIVPVKTLLHSAASDVIEAIAEAAITVSRAVPNTAVIDPNPMLATTNGEPNPDYFRVDGVYLNEEGYAVITDMLLDHLSNDGVIPRIN